jgi:cell cycle arrest protein BUB3
LDFLGNKTMAETATQPPPEAKLLPDCPNDGITALQYLSADNFLLASSSWDGAIRCHDTAQHKLQLAQSLNSGPLLSLCVQDGIVTGGMNGSIQRLQLSGDVEVLGEHENGCSCLAALPSEKAIASAGWNSKFHLWDARVEPKPVSTVDLPGKAFSMDADDAHARLVVATSGRRTCFVDVRKGLAELVLDRESSMKYQTRTVRFFPDGSGVAHGSVEGRVALENLEELGIPAKGKKYAFKCHRVGDRVYPVNCIEFHPKYGTLATGGCDGIVGK